MIDVMPVSVELVKLAGPMLGEKDMATMVDGLGKQKATKVPKLEKVFYESCKSLTELGPIAGLFADVGGIDFVVVKVVE